MIKYVIGNIGLDVGYCLEKRLNKLINKLGRAFCCGSFMEQNQAL